MHQYKSQNAQVMLLSVLVLSGVILSASAIAGLLTFFQLRQANDAVSSAKAVFASDAGIEAESYNCFKNKNESVSFSDPGTRVETRVTEGTFITEDGIEVPFVSIIARGISGKTLRILETQWTWITCSHRVQ